jgi:hypothetical protein
MPPPRRNRGWLWFFLVLFVLTAAASTTLIVYNLKQQLKAEDLEAAWELWKKKGPASYELVYTVDMNENARPETYVVRVRDKKTESVVRKMADKDEPLERRLYSYYGMDQLFGNISDFMRQDSQPAKPRTYTRAVFDPEDGHIWWYVRRVMGSRERVEIKVLALKPLSGA